MVRVPPRLQLDFMTPTRTPGRSRFDHALRKGRTVHECMKKSGQIPKLQQLCGTQKHLRQAGAKISHDIDSAIAGHMVRAGVRHAKAMEDPIQIPRPAGQRQHQRAVYEHILQQLQGKETPSDPATQAVIEYLCNGIWQEIHVDAED
eukprot:NODE_8887_length_676_cov_5.699819_g8626_i0.p2 GENE.NODE_8887_length_676_cov_5.699819_g8626_i0~~NODE_8887_length_676_cov_5.699819_g8626_i0.p2  ORF type:complete len:147 (+),score=18.07 NODE_8887_length_676_cov_5.699819_g8626_i0:154-594(+)